MSSFTTEIRELLLASQYGSISVAHSDGVLPTIMVVAVVYVKQFFFSMALNMNEKSA